MINTNTALEATTSLEDVKAAKPKSGGKGAKARRQDIRRKFQNEKDDKMKTIRSVDNVPHCFEELLPAFSTRPGGIHVSPIGMSYFFDRMMIRLRTVAQRQLSVILTPENIVVMKKVLSHLIYARIAAAHVMTPFVIGEDVLLANAFTSDELRTIDGNCNIVINAFAWAMSHLGRFMDEDKIEH